MWETCVAVRQLATKYGADLEIGLPLRDWALAEKTRQASIPDVGAESAVLHNVPAASPRLYEAMSNRPFQTVGAAFAARNRACLIADDPGLGKTLQAVGAVMEAGITGAILVVAPKSAVNDTWPRELALWAPNDEVVVIGSHLKGKERGYAIDRAHDRRCRK